MPQGWLISSNQGIISYVHPDGIYDDPNGGVLREIAYRRLRRHFSFINQMKLFDIGNTRTFSLNIYANKDTNGFDMISNLFVPSTIDECYEDTNKGKPVPGIKIHDSWDISGHPNRIIKITKQSLKTLALVLGSSDNNESIPLPMLHSREFHQVLDCFAQQSATISSLKEKRYITQMWNETGAQKDHVIERNVHFSEDAKSVIYSGAHIGVANAFYKTSQRICNTHRAFDCVPLELIDDNYYQRTNYIIECDISEYNKLVPRTFWDTSYDEEYRLVSRKMIDPAGERTLISALIPPKTAHTNGLLGIAFRDHELLGIMAGAFASVPYDFFIKMLGKSNFYEDTAGLLPIIESNVADEISIRGLLLNCLNDDYAPLWNEIRPRIKVSGNWSVNDPRLNSTVFQDKEWSWETPLRIDYQRRQALVEIDVLVAMALGMTLQQLKTIYRIQFPVLQQYEDDTWYDSKGRIVFTNNRGLSGVGMSRPEWEGGIKGASEGKTFKYSYVEDAIPGGPTERTIEYVAPFTRGNRELDYEVAWNYFSSIYKQD